MKIINLDLSVRGNIPPLHAKQGDVGRKFKAILTDGGAAYPVPAGAAVSVWYSGASGEGNYTDIGADSAVSVSGNEITVELITQMLANYGEGKLCLAINTADGDQIGTWNIPYMVELLPGMGSAAAQQYFTAFSQAVENLPYPDTTLTVAGRAADAAAVGTALASKAPAGLVTKTIKAADEEVLNNALSEEFATMADDSARFIVVSPTGGALFGGVGMLCELYKRSSSGYGAAKFTGYGTQSPIVFHKTMWSGVWQPMVDGSPTAFAPAGYGLGGKAVRTEDWNTTYDNGFYFGITNTPDESWWYGYVVRDGADENRITQTVYRNGIICTRTGTLSNMGAWEWVNPAMIPGTEYRTTERWQGKPVYKQVLAAGALPASGSTHLDIPTSGTIEYILSARGSVFGQRVFPSSKVAGAMTIDLETHSGGVDVYVSHDFLGGAPFYVTVEYTLV